MCAPREDSAQPAHSRSLIRIFTEHKDANFLHAEQSENDPRRPLPKVAGPWDLFRFFSNRLFSEGDCCAGKKTKVTKVVSLVNICLFVLRF